MQTAILKLDTDTENGHSLRAKAVVKLSFKPFIDFLEEKHKSGKGSRKHFYHFLLNKFKQYPELQFPLDIKDTPKYAGLFELMYTALMPIISDETDQLWALSTPVHPQFFYGTDGFYNIVSFSEAHVLKPDLRLLGDKDLENKRDIFLYSMILERFYDIPIATNRHLIYSCIENESDHLVKYYRLNIDTRFIRIKALKALPELHWNDFNEHFQFDEETLDTLKEMFPPDMFEFEGVSSIHLKDVTSEYALEEIKDVIIDHDECNSGMYSQRISSALKSLIGSENIDFGLIPYLILNNKPIVTVFSGFESRLINQAKRNNLPEEYYQPMVEEFLKNPRLLFFSEITEELQKRNLMLSLLATNGITSYALLPLYYSGKTVGFLEMFSKCETRISKAILARLEVATQLLAQLLQNIRVDFKTEIASVITEKFTSIQPAVQWRFNEVAWNYLNMQANQLKMPVENVYFEDVHPFYGAVDFRNSTKERNQAIRNDLHTQFDLLAKTLLELRKKVPEAVKDEVIGDCNSWLHDKLEKISDRVILKLDNYLQHQTKSFLKKLKDMHPGTSGIIDGYFYVVNDQNSDLYKHRQMLEESMQSLNSLIAKHLETFNQELQAVYPCYFEKIRTDGIEYDIYLGQSIAPDWEYKKEILHDFRFKQLKVMAEIARATRRLLPALPRPLQTTQLIFVYENPIDINFRNDEQRFDVEGSYNIRYQVVKKRIDKVCIKGTRERLTQPGKIALVHFNSWEVAEYKKYIEILQKEQLLDSHIEILELEELQGVEGLKAIRVGVKY